MRLNLNSGAFPRGRGVSRLSAHTLNRMGSRKEPSSLPLNDPARGERLQRVMADAGIAARRACETLIETGRVKVNGRVCDKLPAFVDPKNDRIEVDGRPLASEVRFTYIMMNKPTKVLTAPIGPGDDRPAALAMIEHPSKPRLVAVGGLDFDSSGLLLFTNDGAVVNRLTHPRYGHVRLYQAKVKGRPTPQTVANLAKGVYVFDTEDGFKPEDEGPGTRESRDMPGKSGKPGERPMRKDGPQFTRGRPSNARKVQIDVKVGVMGEGNCTLEISAKHARDEEIVKALALVGHQVRRLHRVAIGPLVLRDLAMGRWRELTKSEIHAVTKRHPSERKQPVSAPNQGRKPGRADDLAPAATTPAASPVPAAPRRRPRVIGNEPSSES
jgi:pseudouridine synthase